MTVVWNQKSDVEEEKQKALVLSHFKKSNS